MRGHCFSGCEARGGLALLAEAAQAGTLPAEISEVLSRKDLQSAFMDMFQLCHLCRPCAKVSSVSSLVSSAGDALDSDLWEVHCCCRRTCCCKHREEMAGHQEGAEALRHPEKNAGTGFSRVAQFKSCFSRGTWHERLVEANVVLQGLVAGALHRHRDTRAQLVDNCDYCQHSFLNRVAAAEVASCKALWPNDTHLLMAVDQVAEAEHVLNGRVFSIVGV